MVYWEKEIAYFYYSIHLIVPISLTASQSDIKLKVQVNGFNLEECTNMYQKAAINLSPKVLCAGGEEGIIIIRFI